MAGPSRRPRIALATVDRGWAEDDDAPALLHALDDAGADAGPASWDDASIDWATFDLVVIRSTWDYAERPAEFLAWTERVGSVTTLANPCHVVRWNIDKHHLGELAELGCRVVPTTYLEPDAGRSDVDRALERDGDVVVKPTISAGSRDTARYRPADIGAARDHVGSLLGAGRSVMVQPYLDAVDTSGETGMVFFDGDHSHTFRKGPLLRPGASPVDGLFAPEEIAPRAPTADELALAGDVLAATTRILGVRRLPYARVDVIRDGEDRATLLELELTEPSFFLATDPLAPGRAARAFTALARRSAQLRPSRN
jgi:hypothetical protein